MSDYSTVTQANRDRLKVCGSNAHTCAARSHAHSVAYSLIFHLDRCRNQRKVIEIFNLVKKMEN